MHIYIYIYVFVADETNNRKPINQYVHARRCRYDTIPTGMPAGKQKIDRATLIRMTTVDIVLSLACVSIYRFLRPDR